MTNMHTTSLRAFWQYRIYGRMGLKILEVYGVSKKKGVSKCFFKMYISHVLLEELGGHILYLKKKIIWKAIYILWSFGRLGCPHIFVFHLWMCLFFFFGWYCAIPKWNKKKKIKIKEKTHAYTPYLLWKIFFKSFMKQQENEKKKKNSRNWDILIAKFG
jgi:hypothetical protein